MSIEAIAWASRTDLPPRDKFVLVALCDHYNRDEQAAWMKQETLARWTGYARETVNRALVALEQEHRLIVSTPRVYADGRRASNVYRVPALERHVTQEHTVHVTQEHTVHVTETHNKNRELRPVNIDPQPPLPPQRPAARRTAPPPEPAEGSPPPLAHLTVDQKRRYRAASGDDVGRGHALLLIHDHPTVWESACRLADRHKPEAVTFRSWLAGIVAALDPHGPQMIAQALDTVLTTTNVRNPWGLFRAVIASGNVAPRGGRATLAPDATARLRERYPEMFTA